MKYSVGYQFLTEDNSFADMLKGYKNSIDEVYFPWPGMPSGRAPIGRPGNWNDTDTQITLISELRKISEMNIKLHLLLNASCWGKHNLSKFLADNVISIVSYLMDTTGLDSLTSMSPLISTCIKKHFPSIDIRTSINMRTGSVKSFEYVSDLYDSFNVQREYNRDFEHLSELSQWAKQNGKKLYLLANSGCMNYCTFQAFHDNVVAHEYEIQETENKTEIINLCRKYYSNEKNRVNFLQSSWIRPEDVHYYEDNFPVLKLATRMHENPELVINAYTEQEYFGNLLDLTEPGFGPLFYPYIVNNKAFPEDWHKKVSSCDKKCHTCSYCGTVFKKVLSTPKVPSHWHIAKEAIDTGRDGPKRMYDNYIQSTDVCK